MFNRQSPLFTMVLTVSTAFLLLRSTAAGQTQLHESIRDLSSFVGQWEGPMGAYGDRPPGTVRVECAPICDGFYLSWQVSFQPQGATTSANVEHLVIGFNPQTKARHVWSFARSAQAHTDITFDQNKLTMKLAYPRIDGGQSKRTVEYEQTGDDQFTVRITNIREAGEEVPDWPVFVLRRSR